MWWEPVICILFLTSVSCDIVVKTIKGELRGQSLKSRNGRDYYSFTGVPYAKPPLDDLRFMPPKPIDPWEGIFNATNESNMCLQNNVLFFALKNLIQGQEDCLYLNVYTPNINKNMPVMFWIHGGGFFAGYGGSSVYGPEYFMDKDVVLVTINYRLALFGFISMEDDVIPGNYGMKDQVMALRWVQENIANFGGDPGQVTIFGESAGGASTGYHLLSPLSKGLFHKAILQSGTPLCTWAISPPGVIRKRTVAVSTLAGCFADTSEDILNCLRKLPATYLVELYNKMFEWKSSPCVLFPPVIESCDSNQETFICHNPVTDFKQESMVPIIVGVNSAEGGLFASPLYNDTSLLYPEVITDFTRVLPNVLLLKHLTLPEHLDEIGERIITKYFPNRTMDENTHSNAVDMIGDSLFVSCAVDMVVKLSSPVYFYLYDYQNELSFNDVFSQCGKPLGVTHCDDMISLFPIKAFFPQGLNKNDEEVSKLMVDIWVKFASSKEPTINGKDNGITWPVFTSIEESSILHIDSVNPKIIKNSFQEKYKFWKELPIYSRLERLAALKTSASAKNEL